MKWMMIIALMLVGFSGYWVWQRKLQSQTQNEFVDDVHYHAGFSVYKDGEWVDFSDLKFMHVEPCSEDEAHDEDEQIEKAHLHNGVGSVVHVHLVGAIWRDLFNNIGYSIDASVAGYINGELVADILDQPIEAYDSAVFVEGDQKFEIDVFGNAVTREEIEAVEAITEACGKSS